MKYWEKSGKYQEQLDEMFEQLVPMTGNCETIGGEAVRAISRLTYDCYNNGWCNNTSGAWHFLNNELDTREPDVREALKTLEPLVNTGGYSDYGQGEDEALELLADRVVEFVNNDPRAQLEGYDMFELQDPEQYEEDEYSYWDDEDEEEEYYS